MTRESRKSANSARGESAAGREQWNRPLKDDGTLDGATDPDGKARRKRSPREALEWSVRYMRRQIHEGAVSVLTHVEAGAVLDRLRECDRVEQELEAVRAQLEELKRR